jgi:hypothetical protein
VTNSVKTNVQAHFDQVKMEMQNIDYESLRTGALSVTEQDTQMWRLLSDVPRTHIFIAWACGLLNIVMPGCGTIVLGCMGDRSGSSMQKSQVMLGVLQFMLSLYLIGYAWSWYWTYLIIKKAYVNENPPVSSNSVLDQTANAGSPQRGNNGLKVVAQNEMNPYE